MFASSLICVAGRGLQPRHVPLPAAGIVVRDQDQQARSPTDGIAPVHVVCAEAAGQEIRARHAREPQARQRGDGRDRGFTRAAQEPDVHVLQRGDDVQRDHAHKIRVAGLHDRRCVGKQVHELALEGQDDGAQHGAHRDREQQD